MQSGETVLVYVKLLDEGVEVYRPTPSTRLSDRLARLSIPTDYDSDERWEFEPGSVVALGRRVFDGEDVFVALHRATPPATR